MMNDKQKWIHVNQILDCLDQDMVFKFEQGDKQFNFKLFYEEVRGYSIDRLIEIINVKIEKQNH